MSTQQRKTLIKTANRVEKIAVYLVDTLEHAARALEWMLRLVLADTVGVRRPRHSRHKW